MVISFPFFGVVEGGPSEPFLLRLADRQKSGVNRLPGFCEIHAEFLRPLGSVLSAS
jgi:hypothetical protein